MTATMNSVRRLATAALVAVMGCGGSDSPTAPVTPPPPVLSIVSMKVTTVSGDTSITEGRNTSLRALAERSDGFTMDVSTSSDVVWTSSDPSLATVSASGVVTALKPGNVLVTASYQRVGGSLRIIIKPDGTPWSQLPPLSEAGKNYFRRTTSGTDGRIWKWPTSAFPLKMWAGPGIPRGETEMDSSAIYWGQESGGKLTHRMVSDSVSALMVAVIYPPLENQLVCARLTMWQIDGEIKKVFLLISPRPSCLNSIKRVLTHEMGHGLGIADEGTAGIMGPFLSWERDSLTYEIINWLNLPEVKPGVKPIDG